MGDAWGVVNPNPISSLRSPASGLARRALALVVATSLLVSGCTSVRTTTVPRFPGQSANVHPGQTVRVTTRTGDRATLKVTTLANDGLAGRDQAFLYTDMMKLEVREFDGLKTTLLVAILLFGAIGVAAGSASGTWSGAGGFIGPNGFVPFVPVVP